MTIRTDRVLHPAIHAECMEFRRQDMGIVVTKSRNGRTTEFYCTWLTLFDGRMDANSLPAQELSARVLVPVKRCTVRKRRKAESRMVDEILAAWKWRRLGL